MNWAATFMSVQAVVWASSLRVLLAPCWLRANKPLRRTSHLLQCSLVISQLVSLSACTEASRSDQSAPPQMTASDGLVQLRDAELREVLVGREFRRTDDPDVAEIFCPGGRWQMIGTRAPLAGRYEIADDRLYVQLRRECRVFLRRADGQLFSLSCEDQDRRSAEANQIRPNPVDCAEKSQ